MSAPAIDGAFVAAVTARLARGQRVRRLLPGGGRLHVDREVPFLCVVRQTAPADGAPGVERLVTSQASYLLAPGTDAADAALGALVAAVAGELGRRLGAFLLVEVWEEESPGRRDERQPHRLQPAFSIVADDPVALADTLEELAAALSELSFGTRPARVDVGAPVREPSPFLPCPQLPAGCFRLGLAVDPVWRSAFTGSHFPLVLLALEARLAPALQRAFFAFARGHTSLRPSHYRALGRRTLAGAAWNVDRRLAEVASSFDFLLLVNPINSERAWREFRASGWQEAPRLLYRPLPLDPGLVKRALYDIPIDRVEDPVLAAMFREKQEELDRQVSMLLDRGCDRFLYGSLLLYGEPEEDLVAAAGDLLGRLPPSDVDEADETVDAEEMCRLARAEVEGYRRRYAPFAARVQVRGDIPGGMMVTRDRLLIGRPSSFPRWRVEALLHHEVGTHLLTFFNGRAQRIRQFAHGLAGYEALQEGLAVFAEFLGGGLGRARLRVLAARVLACSCLVAGASFVETWRRLVEDHGFGERTAFTIVLRVYRGGGLTKDAIYLRGLRQLLAHLERGGELETLLVGKIATRHIAAVQDLWHRNFFRPAPLLPRYLDEPAARERLAAARRGLPLADLAA